MSALGVRLRGIARQTEAHLFELNAGWVWIFVAAGYLTNRERALAMGPVGDEVAAPLVTTWALLELFGALGMLVGVWTSRPNHRIAGLLLLAAGTAMHGVAATAAGFAVRDLIYWSFCATCLLRAWMLARVVRALQSELKG